MMCTSECVLARPLTQCVVPLPHSDSHAADFETQQRGTERVNPFIPAGDQRERTRARCIHVTVDDSLVNMF